MFPVPFPKRYDETDAPRPCGLLYMAPSAGLEPATR